MTFWSKHLRNFCHNDQGVTLVEYGIALILAITVGTVILTGLATAVTGQMNTAKGEMGTKVGG